MQHTLQKLPEGKIMGSILGEKNKFCLFVFCFFKKKKNNKTKQNKKNNTVTKHIWASYCGFGMGSGVKDAEISSKTHQDI